MYRTICSARVTTQLQLIIIIMMIIIIIIIIITIVISTYKADLFLSLESLLIYIFPSYIYLIIFYL